MTPVSRPTLLTERLRLVPLSDDHLKHEIRLDSDPEVVRFVGNGKPRSQEQIENLHRGRMEEGIQVRGLGFWVGFLRTGASCRQGEENFVGFWILGPPKPDGGPVCNQAELGYRLMKKYWRQGLAKEGGKELLRYGFQDLELQRVFAETMAINKASRATMSSIGLRYARTFHEVFDEMIPGSEEGEVEYAITREEWLALMRSSEARS